MLRCTGMAKSVTLVSRTRPALVSKPDFYVGILAAIASTSGCSSALVNLVSERGIPRYLHRNAATTHGNANCTAATISSVHRIGVAMHLSTFVTSPDAPAKSCRICRRQWRSSLRGARKSIKSSAYKEALCAMARPGTCVNAWRQSASLMREFNDSITMTKSIGDRGSPCLSPRAWAIRRPSRPLSSTFVLAVESSMAIQSFHRLGNPMNCNTSRRNGQATESNAFAMSIFSRMDANFLQCSHRHANWTERKLS